MEGVLGLSLKMEISGESEAAKLNTIVLSREDLSLPALLRDQLKSAAEFGKIHELKSIAAELAEIPEVSGAFLQVLKNHLESYELEELVGLIEKSKPI